MASAFTIFHSFTEALAEKKHNLGSDTLKVAFLAAANAPSASGHAVLADLTQISYTFCSPRTLTVTSSAQSGGTYRLTIQDLNIAASGGNVGPFRYVVIYNDTASNDELIGWYDRGADATLLDGDDIDLDFDGSAGVLTLAAA